MEGAFDSWQRVVCLDKWLGRLAGARHSLWLLMLASLAVQPGATRRTDWPAWGRDAGNQRHSPLTQINTQQRLECSCRPGSTSPEEGRRAIPAEPIAPTLVVDTGVLYLSFPFYRVVALEPETGEVLWDYTAPGDWTSPEHSACTTTAWVPCGDWPTLLAMTLRRRRSLIGTASKLITGAPPD